MQTKITTALEELDTFDSYFGKYMLKESTLIIPYINIGISNHPLNPGKRLKFIDRAYLVLTSITFLKENNKRLVIDIDRELPSLYFGGQNLDPISDIIEIEVKAKNGYLQLLPDSQLSDQSWIPIQTPLSAPNMKAYQVEQFINAIDLPREIKSLL